MIRKSLVFSIKAYQRISCAMSFRSCRFYPSCSQYAIEAITRFGVLTGARKSIWRIVRCSPLSKGGFDPVR